jgi:hypothetical protein
MYARLEIFESFVEEMNTLLEHDFINYLFDRFFELHHHVIAEGIKHLQKHSDTLVSKAQILDKLGLSDEALYSLVAEFYYIRNIKAVGLPDDIHIE